jgi:SAM-dependent methyltransferase
MKFPMTRPLARASKRRDYGDFQTPPALVVEILDALERSGGRPDRVLEPTCGRGHFIAELLDRPGPPREVLGLEIQPEHAEVARSLASPHHPTRLVVETADLFRVDLARDLDWRTDGPMLVVGNLPWVTASALGASGGVNGPSRSNVKGLRGIDARTGESNFDISEAIWLKLIRELSRESPTIALLCKSAVARAVLRAIHPAALPITRAAIWKVDAPRWFRASVDACLLRVELGTGPRATEAAVFERLSDIEPATTLGLEGRDLISDPEAYRVVAFADGECPLAWRQGLKHDASPVMELTRLESGSLVNKLGEVVDVEEEFVFPLLKGSDLGGAPADRPRRSVIVTQRRLGEDTRDLERRAPRLWDYLVAHSETFERRKSSIYRGRPPFCLFGVGDYSFAPFKVAISGLHKSPRFRLAGPVDGRPTMLDDTSYFLPCRTLEQASLLVDLLNGPAALGLIRALAFEGAKRPVTKALLQRLDLKALLADAGRDSLWRDEWASDWIKPRRAAATH